MTQAPPKQDLWLFKGTVTAVNENGLKLDSFGDDWINYTKSEWRGSWYDPAKGESVTIQCARDKSGKYYIKTIVLNGHQDFSEPDKPLGAPVTTKELSIIREVALKCATNVAVALIAQGRYQDEPDFAATKQLGIDIPGLAQDLERWLTRVENGDDNS